MKCLTNDSYLERAYSERYREQEDICDLNVNCVYSNLRCTDCTLDSEQSKEEFNRISENKTKLVTVEEVQEAITILHILA